MCINCYMYSLDNIWYITNERQKKFNIHNAYAWSAKENCDISYWQPCMSRLWIHSSDWNMWSWRFMENLWWTQKVNWTGIVWNCHTPHVSIELLSGNEHRHSIFSILPCLMPNNSDLSREECCCSVSYRLIIPKIIAWHVWYWGHTIKQVMGVSECNNIHSVTL
jgi:hypothetical protein